MILAQKTFTPASKEPFPLLVFKEEGSQQTQKPRAKCGTWFRGTGPNCPHFPPADVGSDDPEPWPLGPLSPGPPSTQKSAGGEAASPSPRAAGCLSGSGRGDFNWGGSRPGRWGHGWGPGLGGRADNVRTEERAADQPPALGNSAETTQPLRLAQNQRVHFYRRLPGRFWRDGRFQGRGPGVRRTVKGATGPTSTWRTCFEGKVSEVRLITCALISARFFFSLLPLLF